MTRLNPYIGPRAFGRDDKPLFHGRDRDLERLLNLLIAERIVLLHALSGAGKTSLINAALIPELEEEGFEVLPVMRVNRLLPEQLLKDVPATNRYVFSALLSLARFKDYSEAHEMKPEERDKLKTLTSTNFSEYLSELEKHFFEKKIRIRQAIKQALPKLDEETLHSLSKMSPEQVKAITPLDDDEVKTLLKLKPSEIRFLKGVQGSEIAKHLEPDPIVLIFDQFEEVLSADPTDQKAKLKFSQEIGAALSNDKRWALFSMREDYVASLGSLLLPVPTRLNTRFKLELLTTSAAREAIELPAQNSGVSFEPAAIDKLVDDLRTVKVQRLDGVTTNKQGDHAEPMQLQVVCYRLWEKLGLSDNEDKKQITLKDLEDIQVDQTLAEFYEDCLRSVTETFPAENEGKIRRWVENTLITPGETRGTVFMGPANAGGMSKQVVEHLAERHLLRGEQRAGARWYELTHDRFIEPIKKSNRPWFALQKQFKKARLAHVAAMVWFVLLALTWLFVEFMVTEPLREARTYYAHKTTLEDVIDSGTRQGQLIETADKACRTGEKRDLDADISELGQRRRSVFSPLQESKRKGRLDKNREKLELEGLAATIKQTLELCKNAGYPTLNQAITDLKTASNKKDGWKGFSLATEKVTALGAIVPKSMSTHREFSAYIESPRAFELRSRQPGAVVAVPAEDRRIAPPAKGAKRNDSASVFNVRKALNSLDSITQASKTNWENFKLEPDDVRNLEMGFDALVNETEDLGGLLDMKRKFANRVKSAGQQLRSIDPNRPKLAEDESSEAQPTGANLTQQQITTKYARLFLNYAIPPDETVFIIYLVWCCLLIAYMIFLTHSLLNVGEGIVAFDQLRSKASAQGVTDPLGWAFMKPFPPVIAMIALSCLVLIHIRVTALCYETLKIQLGKTSWVIPLLWLAPIASMVYYVGVHYFWHRRSSAKSV